MSKRVFPDQQPALKADDYHGNANFVRTLPDVFTDKDVKSLNIEAHVFLTMFPLALGASSG